MEMVSFKVENGESEKITQDAYAHGMNKSEYIRFLIEQERQDITEQAKEHDMSVAQFFRYLVAKERKEREK